MSNAENLQFIANLASILSYLTRIESLKMNEGAIKCSKK